MCTRLRFSAHLASVVMGLLALSAARPSPAAGEIAPSAIDIEFEHLSIEQGLSQSIVECIIQDRRGFMWFGTEDGLNKYNGYDFTVLRADPDEPGSISYNHILALCEDHEGFMWIGTFNGGLNRYDPSAGRFIVYRSDPLNPRSISHDYVRTIMVDSEGVLWVGTNAGLNRYDRVSDDFTRYAADPSGTAGIGGDIVTDICEDRSGSLWIGTDGGGLSRFDAPHERFVTYRHDPKNRTSLSANSVRVVYVDRNGTLWVGTVGGGLNRFEADTGTFTRFTNETSNPTSLSDNRVYAIYEDEEGSFWIGTNGGGLNLFDRDRGTFIAYRNDPNDPTSISYDEIYDIFEDRSGVLWIGTYGGGVEKYDRKKKKFATYRPDPSNPNSLSADIVFAIYEDGEGILWIGTHGGGLNRFDRRSGRYTHYRHRSDDPASIGSDIVRSVLVDHTGAFWVATHGGGLNRFYPDTGRFKRYRHDPNDPTSISNDELRCLYEDSRGTLWIGTYGSGIDRFNRETETFTRYPPNLENPASIDNGYVRFIAEDSKGTMWVGTQGGGLERFDPAADTFVNYRHDPADSTSLSNDFVFWMHEDAAGAIWLATWGGGLNRFERETGRFTHYTDRDGLPTNSVYGLLEDEEGNFWISTNFGLAKFNPRTERFKHYTEEDGLQSNEFNGNAFFRGASGEMFFGGIHGFNSFLPLEIKDNPHIPPVVITSFLKMNKEAKLDRPISEITGLELSYKDYVFSFEFAALDFTAPLKNGYAYTMEGLDDDWIYTDSSKRFATYTTLPPGRYVFRVKGSNNDGVWNHEGTAIEVVITPPVWRTVWFRALVIAVVLGLALFFYQRRLRDVRMAAELRAAHAAQMSIMPNEDPAVPGFDISGICIPASEVGGDFYEYFWLNEARTKFGVAVGDVSGKAMSAAMIAVMSSGMIFLRAAEDGSTADMMTQLNGPIYSKTDEFMFTTLCLTSLDTETKDLAFTNAGFNNPIIKSGRVAAPIESVGPRLPLGAVQNIVYQESTVKLRAGSVLVIFSDGIPDRRNKAKDFYDQERLIALLETMNTDALSACQIKDAIIADVTAFAGGAAQNDDMTIVVVKSL